MPLLYRVLMRLAVVALVLGLLVAVGMVITTAIDGKRILAMWLAITIICMLPAALITTLAWVVRPPLDSASLRRLWRE